MYIHSLSIRNLKLLREVDISFTRADGSPRPFTLIVGENGLCKTSLLQAIALAASGPTRANQLSEAASLRDRRLPAAAGDPVEVQATFGFGARRRERRQYPDNGDKPPLGVVSNLRVPAGFHDFFGDSQYVEDFFVSGKPALRSQRLPQANADPAGEPAEIVQPLEAARARNLPFWFVAGYGVERALPSPMSARSPSNPSRDRLQSLFGSEQVIRGTEFAELFPPARSRAFVDTLRRVFVDGGILPHVIDLQLSARQQARGPAQLIESHRFTMQIDAGAVDVPATWLSQGYQATIAWIADLIGQVWSDSDEEVEPARMEGLVLIDELDLHLHPTWQELLVPALKRIFPAMQFVATTHSPMLLAGCEQDEILMLAHDEQGNVVHAPAPMSPKLLTSTEIYEEIFGVKRRYLQSGHDKLQRYAYLAGDSHRSDEEEAELHTLRQGLSAQGIEPAWEPVARESSE